MLIAIDTHFRHLFESFVGFFQNFSYFAQIDIFLIFLIDDIEELKCFISFQTYRIFLSEISWAIFVDCFSSLENRKSSPQPEGSFFQRLQEIVLNAINFIEDVPFGVFVVVDAFRNSLTIDLWAVTVNRFFVVVQSCLKTMTHFDRII